MREIKNCSVAVVGGAGFLGSHLVEYLIEQRGCSVLVIDNLCAGRREFAHPKAKFIHHDITGSEDYLRDVFRAHKVKYVFNYAAYPYIPVSFARPLHVCNVNFFGAMKVINAAQEAGAEGILQVSSAEIYGDCGSRIVRPDPAKSVQTFDEFNDKRIKETDPVLPHSSYGASKAAVDYFCQVAWRERKTSVIALRQFNCVGERDVLHPYVVPEIIGQLNKQISPAVCTKCYTVRRFSDPPCSRCRGTNIDPEYKATAHLGNNSSRDFMYAGDAVRMAVELLERGQFGEVYNLGSESSIKIYDLAKLIGKIMGFSEIQIVEDETRKRPWEIWHLLSDNTKILSAGVSPPQVNLEEALRRTINWLQESK